MCMEASTESFVRVNIIRKRDQPACRSVPNLCTLAGCDYRLRERTFRFSRMIRRGSVCDIHVHTRREGGGRVRVMYVREKYGYEMNGSDRNGLDARLRFSLSADIDTSSSPIA